jgi:4-methylaminobutanoate oxidase (formaldehyde-forming)
MPIASSPSVQHRRSISTAAPTTPAAPATPTALPKRARVVVIGGGIIGTSAAYHFAKMGWGGGDQGVVVLEQKSLTSGTTWHAAGLIETFGSLSETSTSFRKYTRDLYASLEEETGLSTGWKQCGFIELASSRDYLEQFRRIAAFNRRHGVNAQEIGPEEIKKLFPLCNTDDGACDFLFFIF